MLIKHGLKKKEIKLVAWDRPCVIKRYVRAVLLALNLYMFGTEIKKL